MEERKRGPNYRGGEGGRQRRLFWGMWFIILLRCYILNNEKEHSCCGGDGIEGVRGLWCLVGVREVGRVGRGTGKEERERGGDRRRLLAATIVG